MDNSMDVAWTMRALRYLGEWDRQTQDGIFTEFYVKVSKEPDSFGVPIENSKFLLTSVDDGKFYLFSQIITKENLVLVWLMSPSPLRTEKAIYKEIQSRF